MIQNIFECQSEYENEWIGSSSSNKANELSNFSPHIIIPYFHWQDFVRLIIQGNLVPSSIPFAEWPNWTIVNRKTNQRANAGEPQVADTFEFVLFSRFRPDFLQCSISIGFFSTQKRH